MGASRFEVSMGANGRFQWKMMNAANVEVLLGVGFQHKDGCMEAIRAVKENAPYQERYERRKRDDGKLFFRLKSASHLPVAESGVFDKEDVREAAIVTVRKAQEAAVIDKA